MTNPTQKTEWRGDIFRHLDGIVTAPTAFVLYKAGVTALLLEKQSLTLDELTSTFDANDGYLNVALRILCSQGWLNQEVDNITDRVTFSVNENSKTAFELFHLYEESVSLLKLGEKYHSLKFEVEPFLALESLFKNFVQLREETSQSPIKEQILKHIEGIILGPTLVKLGMSGMFHKYFMQAKFKAEEFHQDAKHFERLLDILTYFQWFEKSHGSFSFTEKGLFYAKRSSAYGVTVSYSPTLRKLNELIFGDAKAAKRPSTKTEEAHVDREMNVWGSGGAHVSYFKVVDEIVIELFNRPIEQQPKGILDMGCGNGAFLRHLFKVIEHQTLRGKLLDEHPLMLIGADYNKTALEITKTNLIREDIWAKIVWGDIGRPDLLASDLKENYDIELSDLLNVRTFLDHNRIWQEPKQRDKNRVSTSTGAFAFEGKRISNNAIEDSLKEHFQKWQPFVEKFGLLLVELHTVDPKIVAQNIGRTGATAYDATHGYSDQYIVELEVFNRIMEETGLQADNTLYRKFPDTDYATVSVSYWKSDVI